MRELVLAPLVAWLGTVLAGPAVIPLLRRWRVGQTVRQDGPRRHLGKAGTPTMGGIIFLAGMTAAVLTLAPRNLFLGLGLLATLGYGFLGFLDDYIKVVLKRPLGLRARYKLLGQVAIAALVSWAAAEVLGLGTWVRFPMSTVVMDLGPWYLPFGILVFLGTANAVNLTDGLDGLAAGTAMVALAAFSLLAWKAGRRELTLFSLALAGSCAGFLLFNYHPAKVFMGDTGALALGGALAGVALLTKTELWLPVIGGVFVLETLSVILQVVIFQTTGRRVFRMSPLHHHFELAGWTENQVVHRFWLAALFFAAVGLLLW